MLDIGGNLLPVLIQCTTLTIITLVVSTSVKYTAFIYIVDFVQTTWLICQLMEFRLEL